jgi:hypothetical protein
LVLAIDVPKIDLLIKYLIERYPTAELIVAGVLANSFDIAYV